MLPAIGIAILVCMIGAMLAFGNDESGTGLGCLALAGALVVLVLIMFM